MFNSTGPHYCPDCPPRVGKAGRRLDPPLELLESNYSGTGVDIASCPGCRREFEVAYSVKSITRIASLKDSRR